MLDQQFIEELRLNPGQTALSLSRKIGCTKAEANRTLHNTPEHFRRDVETNTWHLADAPLVDDFIPAVPKVPFVLGDVTVVYDGDNKYTAFDIRTVQLPTDVKQVYKLLVSLSGRIVLDIQRVAARDFVIGVLLGRDHEVFTV